MQVWANIDKTTKQSGFTKKTKKITITAKTATYLEFLNKCVSNGWEKPQHMVDYVNKHFNLIKDFGFEVKQEPTFEEKLVLLQQKFSNI